MAVLYCNNFKPTVFSIGSLRTDSLKIDFRFIPLGIISIRMEPHFDDELRKIQIQYKCMFEVDIPASLLDQPNLALLCMKYGELHYNESESFKLVINHMKMQKYNKFLTDDIILSMHKK